MGRKDYSTNYEDGSRIEKEQGVNREQSLATFLIPIRARTEYFHTNMPSGESEVLR